MAAKSKLPENDFAKINFGPCFTLKWGDSMMLEIMAKVTFRSTILSAACGVTSRGTIAPTLLHQ